jgi:hypothetical protein
LSDEPEIVLGNPDGVVATWRNTCIAVWRLQTRVDALLQMETVLRRQATLYKQVAVLQILEPSVKPLDSEQRAALEQVMRSCSAITSSAVVYEGSGFQAAAVRAVVAGVAALRRHPFPHQVFADVSAAAEFHARQQRQPAAFHEGLLIATRAVRSWRPATSEGLDSTI